MEKFVIEGGRGLAGEITVSGAKNAAIAIIPATVLAAGRCVIENIPSISDVSAMLAMVSEMGGRVRSLGRSTVEIDTSGAFARSAPDEQARNIRASYYFLGALLGRYSEANVPLPGGCYFGDRPIDQHLKGFHALGAVGDVSHGNVELRAEKLTGSQIYFDVVSVGATVNVMLAAVRASGLTVMENCAKEPHIVDLANFLNSMGADVRGAGTDVIKIHGVDHMHGTTYSIIPDQIEAGTYMVAACATGGDLLIKNVIPKHLELISSKLVSAGAEVTEYDDAIRVSRTGPILKTNIKTMPHPGFPTDMQPQMATLLSLAEGTSVITEGVWDHRYRYIDELRRMGANIQVDGKVAVIEGVERLTGAPVRAVDLRAGAAMLIAGMAAHGRTEIEDIHHIERGYEDVVGKLRAVGADIRRVTVQESAVLAAI